jgi:hypothetical protein
VVAQPFSSVVPSIAGIKAVQTVLFEVILGELAALAPDVGAALARPDARARVPLRQLSVFVASCVLG